MEKKEIALVKDSVIQKRSIEFAIIPQCELRLLAQNEKEIEFKCFCTDLFDCLTQLRSQYLEKQGYLILCNGARIDTYPSRMSRQMGGGRKAYITRMGFQAKMNDLVDIFDPVDDPNIISTVSEQIEFHEKWLKSL
jgi:hypothetical protein